MKRYVEADICFDDVPSEEIQQEPSRPAAGTISATLELNTTGAQQALKDVQTQCERTMREMDTMTSRIVFTILPIGGLLTLGLWKLGEILLLLIRLGLHR